MKRTNKYLALVLVIAMLLPGIAGAEDVCAHDGGTYYDYSTYYSSNETGHILMEKETMYCGDCGAFLAVTGEYPYGDWEAHSFTDNRCDVCGYTKPVKVAPPSRAQLQAEAYNAGDSVVGKWITVAYACGLFREADSFSRQLESIGEGHSFKVLDYKVNGTDDVWFKIEVNGMEVWISAGNAQINKVTSGTGSMEGLVGGTCQIIVETGCGRSGAGQEFHNLVTVYKGEKYKIIDAAYSSTGAIWYKIQHRDTPCWIASGLAKMLKYNWN